MKHVTQMLNVCQWMRYLGLEKIYRITSKMSPVIGASDWLRVITCPGNWFMIVVKITSDLSQLNRAKLFANTDFFIRI